MKRGKSVAGDADLNGTIGFENATPWVRRKTVGDDRTISAVADIRSDVSDPIVTPVSSGRDVVLALHCGLERRQN